MNFSVDTTMQKRTSGKLEPPPSFLKVYGWIIMLIIIVMMILLCLNLTYVDVIKGRAIIQAERSTQLQSPSEHCVLEKIWVNENQQVETGDTLATIDMHGQKDYATAAIAGRIKLNQSPK